MQKPSNMTAAEFEKHRKDAQAVQKRRDQVEANPTDHALSLEDRIAALEGKAAPAPAAKKAKKS